MKALNNYLFVSVDSLWQFEEEERYKNIIVVKDEEYAPGERITYWGTVESVSDNVKTVVQDVYKPGDKVYFDYKSINPDDPNHCVESGGKKLYRIPYDNVFALVRGGELMAAGGRIFCEPIFEDDVEEIEVGEGKKMMAKVTSSGIITAINVKHSPKKATVVMCGRPLKEGFDLGVKPGDVVFYHKHADDEYKIEGKKYFVMLQEDVLCKEI